MVKTLLINTLSAYEYSWSAAGWTSENAAWANIQYMITTTATSRYNSGYSAGRTQGRADVTSSPNSYSLYTASQYTAYGTSQYNAGVSAGKNSISWSSAYCMGGGTINAGKTLTAVIAICNSLFVCTGPWGSYSSDGYTYISVSGTNITISNGNASYQFTVYYI